MIIYQERRFLIFLLIFSVLIMGAAFYFWKDVHSTYNEQDARYIGSTARYKTDSQTEEFFLIEKGNSSYDIALKLEEGGLIKNKWSFLIYVFLTGNHKKLQAGKYLTSSFLTIPEIVRKFVSGEIIVKRITIIEGWNLKNIAVYFEEQGLFSKEDFLKITTENFSEEFEFLKSQPQNLSIEGYLFPDTYDIRRGEDLKDVFKKMLANFDKKLTPDLKEEIVRQNKAIFETITMASLLEKEVKTLEEKKIVAGIFWKRLRTGMPLQVDATITYLTGKKTVKIPKTDLEIDSPYNTYKYGGLPLGPICNPGLESILAAVYPQETEFWYYISIPEKTIFSKTLKEHNLAKQKYLR